MKFHYIKKWDFIPMSKFLKLYIKSMRPYLFFITGIAGWLGILFANGAKSRLVGTECGTVSILRQLAVLCILLMSWGINQIMNDLLGVKEDRINAPNRPIASGELNQRDALMLTLFLLVVGALITFFLNPYALIIYFIGFGFNIIYEYLKGIPLSGNIWFGILIAVAPFYRAIAVGKENFVSVLFNKDLLYIALFIGLISSSMCFFTYFKDYAGDKLVNKRTLVVLLSLEGARFLNFIVSSLPFLILFVILIFNLWQPEFNLLFWWFLLIAFIIEQYTAFLYFRYPCGEKAYYSLKWNFEGATLFQVAFMALISPLLSIIVFIIGFILVGYLFDLYKEGLS